MSRANRCSKALTLLGSLFVIVEVDMFYGERLKAVVGRCKVRGENVWNLELHLEFDFKRQPFDVMCT